MNSRLKGVKEAFTPEKRPTIPQHVVSKSLSNLSNVSDIKTITPVISDVGPPNEIITEVSDGVSISNIIESNISKSIIESNSNPSNIIEYSNVSKIINRNMDFHINFKTNV